MKPLGLIITKEDAMRIVSLNTWGGAMLDPLCRFIEREGPKTDVFLLQEVPNGPHPGIIRKKAVANLLNRLRPLLPDHEAIFDASTEYEINEGEPVVPFGLATMVRRTLLPSSSSITYTHGVYATNADGSAPRLVQVLTWDRGHRPLTIINIHGLYTKEGKIDTPARVAQNAKLLRLLDAAGDRVVLMGDFNLNPDTACLAALMDGHRELVLESGVATTRSSAYEHRDSVPFADYCIVGKGIDVRSFGVLPDEVSDHLALALECD